jgi:ubiquinone/menaquinone biosynthesis C-methylase UbiE
MPPEDLRVWVGPFSDAGLFARSGEEMVSQIINLCRLAADAQVLDVGCGCGRLSPALAKYLTPNGWYEGFDVAKPLLDWCKENLEPVLPNVRFSYANVKAGGHNPEGIIAATAFSFPYADHRFDLAICSSVFTHMLPAETEAYIAEASRVLKSGGRCFITAFLFDSDAKMAVAKGSTIFDFKYPIGPSCLTFDPESPTEGVACRKEWLIELLARHGLEVELIELGNWRRVRSHEMSQDFVVAVKLSRSD